jgi:hypothetical protein
LMVTFASLPCASNKWMDRTEGKAIAGAAVWRLIASSVPAIARPADEKSQFVPNPTIGAKVA